MSDFDEFESYHKLSAQLIENLSREQLADCLRILALHVADYGSRFGDIPQEDLLYLLGAAKLDEAQGKLLQEGMEILTGYLASVRDGDDSEASVL